MRDEKPLTAGKVAEILGVDRSTVFRIPRELLPYRQAPSVPGRRPRRFYELAAVEAYAHGSRTENPPPSLEERVSALEAWKAEHQHHHEGDER